MSSAYRLRPAAVRDIDRYSDRIAEYDPRDGRRFVDAVEHSCRQLANMPGLGSPNEFCRSRHKGLRLWLVAGFENYVIVYREVSGGIEVLRVMWATMDMEAELDRGSSSA